MERKTFNEYLKILEYDNMLDILKKYLLSPSLLRLKNVGYFCGMDYASKDVYNFNEKISRYDHSLTVALITWMFTKDIKATLAGLFHNISTPCFSHVIDYMNNDYDKQESTEEKTEEIIRSDKYLLECLENDDILIEDIIDFKRYSVVDIDRPMLCADRLDGLILTGLYWTKSITIYDVRKIIDDLVLYRNEDGKDEIGFKSYQIAKLCLDTSTLIDEYCHSKEDNYMMELLSRITKRVIDLKIINYEDLFLLDEDLLFDIFNKIDDEEIRDNLYKFRNICLYEIDELEMPYIKVRCLNPLVCNKRFK